LSALADSQKHPQVGEGALRTIGFLSGLFVAHVQYNRIVGIVVRLALARDRRVDDYLLRLRRQSPLPLSISREECVVLDSGIHPKNVESGIA
jgi:hypothetical protein